MNEVIIVGNSPSINGCKLGTLIDQHFNVVRLNNFALSGYEEDVGTKTDVWGTTLFRNIDSSRADMPNLKELLLLVNHFPMDKGWSNGWDWIQDKAAQRGIRYGKTSPSQIRLWNRETQSSRPSSGIMAMLIYLERYKKITIVGFDHFQSSKGHHYFNLNEKRPDGCPHNGKVEAEWVRKKVAEGRITRL